MTTESALLAQLQDAWNQSVATGPVQVLANPMKCPQHIDSEDWLDEPVLGRPGWIRTICRHYGVFVGNRPEIMG